MSLSRLLSSQLQRLEDLIALLSSEQEQLTKGSIDGDILTDIAGKKQALLEELERMEVLRRGVQAKLGYPEGGPGAKLAATDADWREVSLALRMKHNQEMLDYIRQIAEKTLYKPNGRNSAQPGRINASA